MKRHNSRNSYEVELLTELNISLVFNILDLIKHNEGGDGDEIVEAQWSIPIASSVTMEIEEILDSYIDKSTRKKTYEGYLVKWKGASRGFIMARKGGG